MMLPMRTLHLTLSLFVLFILTACAFTRAEELAPLPTATTVRVVQTTPVPTIDRQLHAVASPEATATPPPALYACSTEAESAPIQYTVVADLDYSTRTVEAEQLVAYTNLTGDSLDHLIFNVRPNSWPGVFTLENIKRDDAELSYELTGQRLSVELPDTLETGCRIELEMSFRLSIPPIDRGGANAYKGYLGYSERQLNLGHWLPTIAVRQEADWIIHNEIPIGEQDVLDEADWDVTLNVGQPPENLKVAAPGEILSEEPGRWHFWMPNARDFTLSMSDAYNVSTRKAENGVIVDLYTFDDALIQTQAGEINTRAFALDVATQSIAMYSDLYGEYPYPRMVVVQSDFPDGMEFSGLAYVGGEYFRGFNGPTSYLLLITVHEIAHQWWYGRVGNDQAMNPWLDEALSTYSEYVFIEEYYPALRDWWWQFRVDAYAPQGFVDSTVYEFETRREYINAVYLRGVRMLNELRANLGTDTFFDWLRRYAEVGSGRIVDPAFFWSLLTPEQLSVTASTREEYFQRPQIVVISSDNS